MVVRKLSQGRLFDFLAFAPASTVPVKRGLVGAGRVSTHLTLSGIRPGGIRVGVPKGKGRGGEGGSGVNSYNSVPNTLCPSCFMSAVERFPGCPSRSDFNAPLRLQPPPVLLPHP